MDVFAFAQLLGACGPRRPCEPHGDVAKQFFSFYLWSGHRQRATTQIMSMLQTVTLDVYLTPWGGKTDLENFNNIRGFATSRWKKGLVACLLKNDPLRPPLPPVPLESQ